MFCFYSSIVIEINDINVVVGEKYVYKTNTIRIELILTSSVNNKS